MRADFLLLLVAAVFISTAECINPQELNDLIITSAVREVDLTERYAQSNTKLILLNQGKKPIRTFYYSLPLNKIEQTILLTAKYPGGKELTGTQVEDFSLRQLQNTTFIRFELESAVMPQQSVTLTLAEQFSNRLEPYPKQISINENQLIIYRDNAIFFSPYVVQTQYTIYKANNVISNTETAKSSKIRKTLGLKYGDYTDVQPFSSENIQIHCENNTPLIYLTKANKSIQVSHWGNISVDSSYNLVNGGANLQGEFGRVDYNKYNPQAGKNAMRSLSAQLPFHATGVWYRDVIGNISTSNAFRSRQEKSVKLSIQPRFPVLGGWKSAWSLGYNLNTTRYLSTDGQGQFQLKQLFSIPFDNLLAEEYELRVILPEGATDIKVDLPFSVDDQHMESTYSYLDTNGSPTLVIKKKNVIDFHNQYFYVYYQLSTINAIKKPLMIMGAFLAFFLGLIVLNRMSLKSLRSEAK